MAILTAHKVITNKNYRIYQQQTLRRLLLILGTVVLSLSSQLVQAASISIIIDDIGYSHTQGLKAIALPKAVTLSIIPTAPYANILGAKANNAGHETMLHIPMQAINKAPYEQQTLTTDMSKIQLQTTVSNFIDDFPYISGLNNHMGSLLTTQTDHMGWLMETISSRVHPLFFVDSRTTTKTRALLKAQQFAIPSTRRDVFLDNSIDADDIRNQLQSLKQKALKEGFALGIAHPHPTTIKVLQRELPILMQQGFELIPVSEYIKQQQRAAELQLVMGKQGLHP